MGPALAILLEKSLEKGLDPSVARTVLARCTEALGQGAILFLAGLKGLRPSLASHAANVAAKHFGLDARCCHAGCKTEGSAKRGGVGERVVVGAEDLGAAEGLRQKRVEYGRARFARHQVERARALARGAEFDERRVARLEQEPLRVAFVENVEVRRDIRLEREEAQQALGEGVQRLNLEAARALDGAREQLPREDEIARTRRVRAALDNCLRQGAVAEARPLRELAEHAIGHIRSRCLGVSEA